MYEPLRCSPSRTRRASRYTLVDILGVLFLARWTDTIGSVCGLDLSCWATPSFLPYPTRCSGRAANVVAGISRTCQYWRTDLSGPAAPGRSAAFAITVCLSSGAAASVGKALVGVTVVRIAATALTVGELRKVTTVVASGTVTYRLSVRRV